MSEAAAAAESARRVAPMKLLVRVVEARGLPAVHLNGSSDPFVKLKLGKRRAKTAVVKRSLAPAWDEEFAFRVGDLRDNLLVSVLHEDRYFADDVLGQVKVPLTAVLDADNRTLGMQWYQLQPKSKKSKLKDCGKDTPCPLSCFIYLHITFQFVTFVSTLVSYYSVAPCPMMMILCRS